MVPGNGRDHVTAMTTACARSAQKLQWGVPRCSGTHSYAEQDNGRKGGRRPRNGQCSSMVPECQLRPRCSSTLPALVRIATRLRLTSAPDIHTGTRMSRSSCGTLRACTSGPPVAVDTARRDRDNREQLRKISTHKHKRTPGVSQCSATVPCLRKAAP